jgi:molybdopterin molybdotransferase
MITVTEAKEIIRQQLFEKKIVRQPVFQSVNKVLAEDVHALVDIPSFNQSSMDGYAFAFQETGQAQPLKVVEEVPAGKQEILRISEGTAARIFTGAALPQNTDTVVMQELVTLNGNDLTVLDKNLVKGQNVRVKGAEIEKGERALKKGTYLSPATIGFLSAIGIAEVATFASPVVSIIITGDELQMPGEELLHGQVYEASSSMLQAALFQMGIRDVIIYYAKDTLEDTTAILDKALISSDLILLTGGVSVGDYDFVVKAAALCGIDQLFHRLKQRPGKPLFFGRKGNKPVFGLPGNPSSVLTCFYEYVWAVLRRFEGHEDTLRTLKVPLSAPYTKTNQLTHFLKGTYKEGKVEILPGQESFRLRSFAEANCIVALGEEMKSYELDELVEVHLIPLYG